MDEETERREIGERGHRDVLIKVRGRRTTECSTEKAEVRENPISGLEAEMQRQ